ncbi:MAG: ADP-ribosyltransferase domain-containing protein [Oligoflexales bacterium]
MTHLLTISTLVVLITTCKTKTSDVKKVQYNTDENSIPTFSLDFCDDYTFPTTSNNTEFHRFRRAKDEYRKNFSHYLLDTLATRLFYVNWPPPGPDLPTDKQIGDDDLHGVLGTESACFKKKDDQWWNPFAAGDFDHVAPIKTAVDRFNSEQIHMMIYPAFVKTTEKCDVRTGSISEKFKKQTVLELRTQVEDLCADHNRLDYFYLNPGMVAAFFLAEGNDTETNRMGFCAARKADADHLAAVQQWNIIEPWIISGGAMAAGTLANLGTAGVGGQIVDWAAFGVSLGSNLMKYQFALERLAELKEIEANLDISQNCSSSLASSEIENLRSQVFFDIVGQAAGSALGWAAPGIGRGIAGLFRAGKASFQAAVGPAGRQLYVVFPGVGRFLKLPPKDVFAEQIRSGFQHVKGLLPDNITKYFDDIIDNFSKRYDDLVDNSSVTAAKNIAPDSVPKSMIEDIINDANKFGSASQIGWTACRALGLVDCGVTYALNFKAPAKALKKFAETKEFIMEREFCRKFFNGDKVIDLPQLSVEEFLAIRSYAGSGFRKVNEALRIGKLDEQTKAFADVIASGLRKLPTYKRVVYRKTHLSQEVIEKYQQAFKAGDIIQERGFTSTTINQVSNFNGNADFIIESKTGVLIEKISSAPGEREVLFAAGSKFKILGVQNAGEKWTIMLSEI